MKALLSLSGAVVLGLSLCCGMCSRKPDPVESRYSGPGRVHAGQTFPFSIHLKNNTAEPVTIESVVVPASLIRNLQIEVETAQRKEPFGDGVRAWIAPVTIEPGAEQRVADFSGVPFVSGWASGRLELCEVSGTCHRAAVNANALGGAPAAMRQRWTLPDRIEVDKPFDLSLTVENVSGGPDRLTSAGINSSTARWLELTPVEPSAPDKGRDLLRETWQYNIELDSGQSTTLTFQARPTAFGEHTFTGTICPTSQTMCADSTTPVVVH